LAWPGPPEKLTITDSPTANDVFESVMLALPQQPLVPAAGAGGSGAGAHEKSNRSRSPSALASRAVSAGSPNSASMKRVIAV
jgi:hypothetical protein